MQRMLYQKTLFMEAIDNQDKMKKGMKNLIHIT